MWAFQKPFHGSSWDELWISVASGVLERNQVEVRYTSNLSSDFDVIHSGSLGLSFSICEKKQWPTKPYITSSLLWEPIIWLERENDHKKFKAYFPNIYSEKCKTNSEKGRILQ